VRQEDKKGQSFIRREKRKKIAFFAFFIITYYRFDSDSNVKKSFWCYHTLVGEYKK